jgi:hypothetical protein
VEAAVLISNGREVNFVALAIRAGEPNGDASQAGLARVTDTITVQVFELGADDLDAPGVPDQVPKTQYRSAGESVRCGGSGQCGPARPPFPSASATRRRPHRLWKRLAAVVMWSTK